jgi:hypothetical protein
MPDLLTIGQLLSVILAAGTPGMTYYVMVRQNKQQIAHLDELHQTQIEHMKESCSKCRRNLEEKLGDIGEDLGEVSGRQKELREKTLPDAYVMRRDFDKCRAERREAETTLHRRLDTLHLPTPAKGGT